jgi:hypothetical protein
MLMSFFFFLCFRFGVVSKVRFFFSNTRNECSSGFCQDFRLLTRGRRMRHWRGASLGWWWCCIGTLSFSSTQTCRRSVYLCTILAKHLSGCPVAPSVIVCLLALSSLRHLWQTSAQAARFAPTLPMISITASSGNTLFITSSPPLILILHPPPSPAFS